MTTIEELKACLEQNKSIDELIVLKYDKESYLKTIVSFFAILFILYLLTFYI